MIHNTCNYNIIAEPGENCMYCFGITKECERPIVCHSGCFNRVLCILNVHYKLYYEGT